MAPRDQDYPIVVHPNHDMVKTAIDVSDDEQASISVP